MKTVFALLILALFISGGFLLTPVGLFLFQATSLEFSDQALQEELVALSSVIISEAAEQTDTEPPLEVITVALTNESLGQILTDAFRKQETAFLRINRVRTKISPDIIALEISYQFGVGDHRAFETTVFSQWALDIFPPASESGTSQRFGVKPLELHTNHLYSVNLATLCQYLLKHATTNGWLLASPEPHFRLEGMILQEETFLLNLLF